MRKIVLSGWLIAGMASVGCGGGGTFTDDDDDAGLSSSSGGSSGTSGSSSGSSGASSSSSSGGSSSSSGGSSSSSGSSGASSSSGGSSSSGNVPLTYSVSVTVTGLVGTGLVLQNNGGDDKTVAADGNVTFATELADNAAFAVTILTQPGNPAQTCQVAGGTGTVAGADVTSVTVNCASNKYTIGGTVTGLLGTGLVLQNAGGDDRSIAINGEFAFATAVPDLSLYAVTVLTQPTGKSQTCTVTGGAGAVVAANVTSVAIACVTNSFTVSADVTGLEDGDELQLSNGADTLTFDADDIASFLGQLDGSAYDVKIVSPPLGKTCTLAANAAGTLDGSDLTVVVKCSLATSCSAIKSASPAAVDGTYRIDTDGDGPIAPMNAYCDMTTDGGGYTSVAVVGGISTSRFDDANSCQALGLQIVVPRSKAHVDALIAKYTLAAFSFIPGVYGVAAGNYTTCSMNSGDAVCAANWKAIDGNAWFLRDIPYSEPNGDYTPGCWLGTRPGDANGFQFNDAACGYGGANYVCSDNAK